ncbi:MAG: twin-arginine translocase TatA/TatE family subunit [Alphaproteobacteria bacterium]
MFGIGLGEMLLIVFVALIVFGPDQLPEVARQGGIFLHNLKINARVLKDDMLGRDNHEQE